jgi:predicted MFS family arabinose efflux permease
MNALAFPYTFILPVFARDVLAVDPIGLGILGAASGIGSLSGALVLAARGRVRRAGRLFWVGSLAMSAGVALFAVSSRFELAVALLLLSGLGSSTFSAFQSTIILGAASERLRGRAMGVLTLAIGTAPDRDRRADVGRRRADRGRGQRGALRGTDRGDGGDTAGVQTG